MGSPSYVLELQKSVDRYGLNEIVAFCGPLSGEEKDRAFSEASAFVLPSYTESFGISIAEAMAWALPVITTTETPWSIVKEKKMGWIVSPKISSISESIFQLTQTSSQELNDMGLRARTYVKERYDWNYLGIRMAKIYESLMS